MAAMACAEGSRYRLTGNHKKRRLIKKLHFFLQEFVLQVVFSDSITGKKKIGFKQSSLIGVVLEISVLLRHYAA